MRILVSNKYFPSQALFADGSAAAPSISFVSKTNTGFYLASGLLAASQNGALSFYLSSGGGLVASQLTLDTSSADVILARDAANTLAQRNGVSGQIFRPYRTYTDASNYERLNIGADISGLGSNTFGVVTQASGTGTARPLYLGTLGSVVVGLVTNGTTRWTVNASGHLISSGNRLQPIQGADVASANNLALGADGNVFEITGTTQINLISNLNWQNGSTVTLYFTSNPVVKHNQATSTTDITIQLAGAVDFSATAGDTLTLQLGEIGGTQAWREIGRAVI